MERKTPPINFGFRLLLYIPTKGMSEKREREKRKPNDDEQKCLKETQLKRQKEKKILSTKRI